MARQLLLSPLIVVALVALMQPRPAHATKPPSQLGLFVTEFGCTNVGVIIAYELVNFSGSDYPVFCTVTAVVIRKNNSPRSFVENYSGDLQPPGQF